MREASGSGGWPSPADESQAPKGAAARAFGRTRRRHRVGSAETNGGIRLMDRIRISGGRRWSAHSDLGAKNAALNR